MALSGKKITELNPISDVTNKTVLPTVYIDDTYTEATATKVTVQQLKNNILNGAVLQPNIITDTESTSIELNKILANTIYQYGTLSSLSITTFDTSYQDSYIYFKTSENGFNFSFSTANWITLYEPSFKLNTDYIIHLKNGVCVLEQPENPILNITATSGNITLRTNTVNSCTISGNTTFVLPQTVNNNILNKIILQIKITGTPTIDWGTTHYLVDSFTLTPGTYDIVYEYDSLNSYWKVGLLYSTGGGGGGDVPDNVYTQDNLVAGINISITENSTAYYNVSNFNTNNYIEIPQSKINWGNGTWSVIIKTKTPQAGLGNYGDVFIVGNSWTAAGLGASFDVSNDKGRFNMGLSSSGSSWNIGYFTPSTYDLNLNTDYWLKYSFDGTSTYKLQISTDGQNFDDYLTQTSTKKIMSYSYLRLGSYTSGTPYKGIIDVKGIKIVIGGVTTFDGATAIEGTDFNIVGNPTISQSEGSKYYKINNTQDVPDLSSYLQNTATGTNAITILGTPTNGQSSINIGKQSSASGTFSASLGGIADSDKTLSLGISSRASGQGSIAIGYGARASNGAMQIGNAENSTARTLQVYSYQLLDGNTGKIPADRLPNVFANIQKAANFNVVGSISIDYNWVASNFSNTRYLIGPNNPTGAITSAQFDLKIKTPSSLSGDNFRCMLGQSAHNFYTPQIDFIGNEFHFRVSTDGTSWKDVAVSGQFSTNTDYYIRGVFDGTKLQAFKSANGVDYTQIGSDVPCSSMYWAEQMLIGLDTDAGGDLTGAWTGSIYLEDLSIKINGQDYWKAVNFMNSNLTLYPGYNASETQVLKNINGTLTWVNE